MVGLIVGLAVGVCVAVPVRVGAWIGLQQLARVSFVDIGPDLVSAKSKYVCRALERSRHMTEDADQAVKRNNKVARACT